MPGVEQQTDYEKVRQQNMLNNEKLLQDLMGQKMDLPTGLAAGFAVLGIAEPKPKPEKAPKPKATKPKVKKEEEEVEREGRGSRRSARQASKPTVSFAQDGERIVDRSKMPRMVSRPDKDWNEDDTDGEEDAEGKVRVNKLVGRVHDPKTFGLIPGVPIGSWWDTRAECSAAAIHAPFVAGISGGPEGAYSVALSGGYDDDIDMGDAFTYTGSGGRDLKGTAKNPKNLRTAPQSSHQSFEHSFNKSLKVSSETRKPVRVIRGYKLPGVYAPETGYRYDGLYIVERAWMDRGNNSKGWQVCKFAFRRIPGQPPIPRRGQASRNVKADAEMKDAEEDGGEEEEEEPEEKPKRGRKAGPKSKAKAEDESGEEEQEEEEEEEEEEKPAPARKGRKVVPKSKTKDESEEEPEEKSKKGRKAGPKSKVKEQEEEVKEEEEPEGEEEQPAPAKKGRGRKVEPKSKTQSEPESEPVSKRGRKPKVESEPEEEQEEEVPPAKRTKVEEGVKKRGRPAKK